MSKSEVERVAKAICKSHQWYWTDDGDREWCRVSARAAIRALHSGEKRKRTCPSNCWCDCHDNVRSGEKRSKDTEHPPGWLIWALMRSGASVLRAICTTEALALMYQVYLKDSDANVERVIVEESRMNHLYFGLFEKGPLADPKNVRAALKSARNAARKQESKRAGKARGKR